MGEKKQNTGFFGELQ